MRAPVFRGFLDPSELVGDFFAGGGGVSTGMEEVIDRPVDMAINHDPEAIAMHAANHPETRHYCENIFEVDPVEACAGRPMGAAWFSPDCTHHSRAKGGKPRDNALRGLAWVVVRWAKAVRPRMIFLENVPEFESWGPLLDDGRPDPGAAGETFRAWLAELSALGYRIEFRSLVAADYGAPTTRKRFFLVARLDGSPIVWPAPTHGKGRSAPYRSAAEIIDWSLPCPSIFDRARPLAEATQRRIAEGIRRFVLTAADPFLVKYHAQDSFRGQGLDEPLRTIDTQNRFGLVVPSLIQRSWGERKGQRPRCMDIGQPLGTIVAGGVKHAVVAAWLTKHFGGVVGHGLERAIGTVTARDHHALTTATLAPTGVDRRDEVRAFLIKFYGAKSGQEQQVSLPLHTVTTKARFGLVTIAGEDYEIADIGMRMLSPRELFAAQGFPAGYEIEPMVNGRPLTKTAQIRCAGNSVPPPVAAALVGANLRGDARSEAA